MRIVQNTTNKQAACRVFTPTHLQPQSTFYHMTVGSIGYECDFLSESHFNRTFKSRYGISPSEMRMGIWEASSMEDASKGLPVFPSWVTNLPKTGLVSDLG
ncbi:MAG: AraC family transcriptional regulator [Methylocystaceae bacterium]|nr:AraC family transcriptional regulator [Methylocystaceae bacterium]